MSSLTPSPSSTFSDDSGESLLSHVSDFVVPGEVLRNSENSAYTPHSVGNILSECGVFNSNEDTFLDPGVLSAIPPAYINDFNSPPPSAQDLMGLQQPFNPNINQTEIDPRYTINTNYIHVSQTYFT